MAKNTSSNSTKPQGTGAKDTATVAKPSVSSTNTPEQARRSRRFLAATGLLSAALIATTIGLMGYQKHSYNDAISKSNQPYGSASLYIAAEGLSDVKAGQTFTVELHEDSGKDLVNAVQAGINYPAEKLQVVSVTTGDGFPQEAATDTTTPGLVRVARSVVPKTPAVRGQQSVAKIEFKVLPGATGPVELRVDQTTSLLVRSTDNKNVLSSVRPATLNIQ
ncbi:MAG TPA: cohesin domain-containing protein [Candidatus Saccharimonadales bacterium]|jgi:hypothetical protein